MSIIIFIHYLQHHLSKISHHFFLNLMEGKIQYIYRYVSRVEMSISVFKCGKQILGRAGK